MENKFFKDYQSLIESFEALKKSESNPFFKSKYVPLKTILPIVKENCKKHNFIFMQFPLLVEGKNSLQTKIIHETGEEVSGSIEIVAKDATDPQKVGGGLTYMRRYSLTCMFGLEEEDDDGNTASQSKEEKMEKIGFCNVCGEQGMKAKRPNGSEFTTCKNWSLHKDEGEKFKIIFDDRTKKEKEIQEELNNIK